ncbi:hypothetical protein LUQ84_003002 [Hamiltosporidium tvaerminnensis]|nr:hypothetical protein LUQ84_003002 [Hamiltosporidium tvaerminnensis]
MNQPDEITSIDLSKHNLYEIPEVVLTKTDLNWLILSHNRLSFLPPQISHLKNLTRLALNDNRLITINPSIGSLTSLTWIDLTRNNLSSLPSSLKNLKNIHGLGLSENNFSTIPPPIFYLFSLKKFGFFSNRLTQIPPQIKNLKNLTKLDLSNNSISTLPLEFCSLTNLTWLNLTNNKIHTLPHQINNLYKLEELGLGNNTLSHIPPLTSLTKLRILPLFKNKITKISLNCISLEKLDLSDNLLEEFPYTVIYMKNIKYLNLKNNRIKKIEFTYKELYRDIETGCKEGVGGDIEGNNTLINNTTNNTPLTNTNYNTTNNTPLTNTNYNTSNNTPLTNTNYNTSNNTPLTNTNYNTSNNTPLTNTNYNTGNNTPLTNTNYNTSNNTPLTNTNYNTTNNTPNNITNTFITPLDILPVNTSLTVVDLSDNNLSFLPQKFYKIFTGVSSVRLYNNPFIYLHYKIPLKCPSLLQMCYSKCVNKGMVRDFWMNCKFNKNNFCDVCGTVYVSEGVVCYDVGNVGEGGVVIKKEMCSFRCYSIDNKYRGC